MIAVHRLLDQEAVDQWIRSVLTHLTALSDRADADAHCGWLILRCTDTLRYDYDPQIKYQSVLHLIDDLERFAVECSDMLAPGLTLPARALVTEAERKRFLNA